MGIGTLQVKIRIMPPVVRAILMFTVVPVSEVF